MGKYMRRKCGGGGAAGDSKAAPAALVLGARTRSRSASTVVVAGPAKRRKQATEATTTAARAVDEAVLGRHDDGGGASAGGGCYIHLRRSRRLLFKPADAPRGDLAAEAEASTARLELHSSAASGQPAVARISRCSSTASSTVDVAARARSGGEAEARCEGRDVESSVSDSERDGRERRETTPTSRPAPVDLSDLESSQATTEGHERKRCRRNPATTTTASTTSAILHLESRARMMPAAAEIEQFFSAAEKAQAERFAAKYNFDVALGVPLNAGRFDWTPVATI